MAAETKKPKKIEKKEPQIINIDADLHNADWTKQTWDILPATVEVLLDTLSLTPDDPLEKKRAKLAEFMQLPVAKAMPSALRRALHDQGLL